MGAATGGYYELTGWADRLPAGPFLAYTDATSPRLTAALIMAALDFRERTDEGMVLDFSQAEGGIHFLTEAILAPSGQWIPPESKGETLIGGWHHIRCTNARMVRRTNGSL
ncbi:MAG: hypothetical protein Ct9H300mP26_1160 [Acidimicrobiales bacterium]|nr:MAG: hypothetical protein Ct9H300mP26_1160 [Acidimicrobiales bacterium]